MEPTDLNLIERHLQDDPQLERLYQEHVEYEKVLTKLDHKPFLTPTEGQRRKELQKKKLLGKDLIEDILEKYRGQRS